MDVLAAPQIVWAAVILIFLVVVGVSSRRKRHGRRTASFNVGPGTTGAIYDLLNEDKRKAIEIIVEQKAEARDPETADDTINPPDANH